MRARFTAIAVPIATATLALGTAAWAANGTLPLVPTGHIDALAVTAQATGPLVANDLDGSAILSAAALAPGQTTTGEVTISNAGDAPGAFTLSPSSAVDSGAPLAGPLSAVLDLSVVDITGASPVTVFTGKLGALPRVALGTFTPGEAHRYRFALTYPGGRVADLDNLHQGASTSIRFDWDAVAVGGSAGTPSTTLPAGGAAGAPAGTGGAASYSPSSSGAKAAPSAPAPAAAAAIPATSASTIKVALGVPKKKAVRKGRLMTWMSSSATARARVTGTVSWRGHKKVKLPPATVKLTAKRTTVRLRLPAAAVRGTRRKLTVRLAVTAVAGGNKATVRRTVRVTSR